MIHLLQKYDQNHFECNVINKLVNELKIIQSAHRSRVLMIINYSN